MVNPQDFAGAEPGGQNHGNLFSQIRKMIGEVLPIFCLFIFEGLFRAVKGRGSSLGRFLMGRPAFRAFSGQWPAYAIFRAANSVCNIFAKLRLLLSRGDCRFSAFFFVEGKNRLHRGEAAWQQDKEFLRSANSVLQHFAEFQPSCK